MKKEQISHIIYTHSYEKQFKSAFFHSTGGCSLLHDFFLHNLWLMLKWCFSLWDLGCIFTFNLMFGFLISPGQKDYRWLWHPDLNLSFSTGGLRHYWHLHTGSVTANHRNPAQQVQTFFKSSNTFFFSVLKTDFFFLSFRNSMCHQVFLSRLLIREVGLSAPLVTRSPSPLGWWGRLLFLPCLCSFLFSWKLKLLRTFAHHDYIQLQRILYMCMKYVH